MNIEKINDRIDKAVDAAMRIMDGISKAGLVIMFALAVTIIVIQVDMFITRNFKKEGLGSPVKPGNDTEYVGITNLREYAAAQAFLTRNTKQNKGDVVYLGLENGRILRVKTIIEGDQL